MCGFDSINRYYVSPLWDETHIKYDRLLACRIRCVWSFCYCCCCCCYVSPFTFPIRSSKWYLKRDCKEISKTESNRIESHFGNTVSNSNFRCVLFAIIINWTNSSLWLWKLLLRLNPSFRLASRPSAVALPRLGVFPWISSYHMCVCLE